MHCTKTAPTASGHQRQKGQDQRERLVLPRSKSYMCTHGGEEEGGNSKPPKPSGRRGANPEGVDGGKMLAGDAPSGASLRSAYRSRSCRSWRRPKPLPSRSGESNPMGGRNGAREGGGRATPGSGEQMEGGRRREPGRRSGAGGTERRRRDLAMVVRGRRAAAANEGTELGDCFSLEGKRPRSYVRVVGL